MTEERSSRSEERNSSRSSKRSSGSRSSYVRSMRRGEDVFKQGETSGPGEYRFCVTCNADRRAKLNEDKLRLPPCGKCGPAVTAEFGNWKIGREKEAADQKAEVGEKKWLGHFEDGPLLFKSSTKISF